MTRRPRRLVLHILAAATLFCASPCSGTGMDAPVDSLSARLLPLLSAGRIDDIEKLCRDRLAAEPADSLEIATLDQWLAISLFQRGKIEGDECLQLARRTLAIRERHLTQDDPAIAEAAMMVADIRTRLADYEGVDSLYLRAIAIREAAFGPRNAKLARVLANYAIFLKSTGQLDRARETYERTLSIEKETLGPDDPSVARTLFNLGNLLIDAGVPGTAEKHYREAIAICERSPSARRIDIARYRTGLASALTRNHQVIEAREELAQAIETYEAELGPTHQRSIETAAMLASVLREIGDVDQAEPLMARAFQGYERQLGPDHPKLAQILAEWAAIRLQQGDIDGAIEMSRRSLAIRERALGNGDLATAFAMNELSKLCLGRGDVRAADSLASRSIEIETSALGPDSLRSPTPFLTRIECFRRTGRGKEAGALLRVAEEIVRRTVGERHPSYDACLRARVHLLADEGRSSEALAVALQSLALQRNLIRSIARGLPERQALQYLAGVEPAQDLVLDLLVDHPEDLASAGDAWTELVESRALVLDEMAARRRALAGSDRPDSVRAREVNELAELTRELAWMLTSSPDPVREGASGEQFAATRARQEEIERRLALEYSPPAQAPQVSGAPATRELSPAMLGSDLPGASVLVSYFRYRHESASTNRPVASVGRLQGIEAIPHGDSLRYAAMIVHPGEGAVALVDLGRADDVDLRIARWRDEVEAGTKIPGRTPASAEAFYRAAGGRLREAIWDPIAPFVLADSVVFFIPDGEISLVDPATLPTGQDRYLIDGEQRFHTATTERDLLAQRGAPQVASGLFAIGAPDFDSSASASGGTESRSIPERSPAARAATTAGTDRGTLPSCEEFARVTFRPLPGAAQEVDQVVSLWNEAPARDRGDAERLVGAAASEGAFKALASRRRILHIASHGFFLGADCGQSIPGTRGVGGVAPSESARSPRSIAYNPLLLSGIALAGANLRATVPPVTEDGILTAAEISEVDLAGTQWAVLSACDTGLGAPYAGEGILGLRRGFQIAGAETVIMSLWSVDDQIVREWMARLYRARLEEGLSTPEALHDASHGMLQERRRAGQSTHPYYWAGFVAAGGWR